MSCWYYPNNNIHKHGLMSLLDCTFCICKQKRQSPIQHTTCERHNVVGSYKKKKSSKLWFIRKVRREQTLVWLRDYTHHYYISWFPRSDRSRETASVVTQATSELQKLWSPMSYIPFIQRIHEFIKKWRDVYNSTSRRKTYTILCYSIKSHLDLICI